MSSDPLDEDGSDFSDDDTGHARQGASMKALFVAVLVSVGAAAVYLGTRGADYGPWTYVSTADPEGVKISLKPTAKPDESSLPIRVHQGKNLPAHLTEEPRHYGYFCNASTPIAENWGVRGPFNMSPSWEETCLDAKTMPPMTWNWPGRNWCWVRTKTRSCYPHDGEATVPNWYWAQRRVAQQGFAPDPDEELMLGLEEPSLCDLPALGQPWYSVPEHQKESATAWVNNYIEIYVVSLPQSTQRWQAMEGQFARLGLKGHRLPGVDLRAPGSLERAQQEGLVPKDYHYDDAMVNMHKLMARSEKGGILKLVDEMGIGTVGCAAAHLRAQRLAHRFAKRAGKPMALIMEDDIQLSDDFAPKLQMIVTSELPCNWDVFALTTRCGYGRCVTPHVSRVQPDGNEPEERCHNSGNYGMFGMLYKVTSLPRINHVLQSVCFNDSKPACLPVDIAMASISDRIAYYAVPGSQQPGLAQEASWGGSARAAMNEQALSGEDAKLDRAAHRKR